MTRNFYGQRTYTQQMPYREKTSTASEFRVRAMPSDYTVAMAYVPMQTDTTVFEDMKALSEGTLFCTLCKPFAGMGDRR